MIKSVCYSIAVIAAIATIPNAQAIPVKKHLATAAVFVATVATVAADPHGHPHKDTSTSSVTTPSHTATSSVSTATSSSAPMGQRLNILGHEVVR